MSLGDLASYEFELGNLRAPPGVLPDVLLRAALVVLLVVPACTSSDAPARSAARAAAPTPDADAELRTALERYVECLRAEGVDATEPAFDDAGRVTAWPTYGLTASARSAEKACNREVSEIAFRARGEAAVFLERSEQYADCLRAEGVTDIEVSLDGIRIGPDSTNREIRAAEGECRHFMEGS